MFLRISFRFIVLSGLALALLPLQAQMTSFQGDAAASAAPTLGAQEGGMSGVLTLRQKEQQLLDQLMLLQPSDPDYNKKIQSIGQDLRTVQKQLLGVDQPSVNAVPQETAPTSAPAPALRSRAAAPSVPAQPLNPPAGRNTPLQVNTPNTTVPYASLLPESPAAEETAPSASEPLPPAENSPATPDAAPQVNPTVPPVSGAFDAMNDPALLQQIKEELTFQLKQIQDVLGSLGPQDQALAESFKLQRGELLQQLMEVNERLGQGENGVSDENAATDTALPQMTDSFPEVGAGLLPFVPQQSAPSLETNPNAFQASEPTREEKLQEASNILRTLGLATLADQVLLADSLQPNLPEMTPNAANPQWYDPEKGTADEVKELRASVEAMSEKMDQMANDIKDLTAQIKLLTRQATSAQR